MNTAANQKEEALRVYLTPRQLADKYKAFTESSVRYIIFHSETNGFKKCLKRIGRKILIDENLFIQWVDQHGA